MKKRKTTDSAATQPEIKQRSGEYKAMENKSDLPIYSKDDLSFLVSSLGVDFDALADRSFLITSIQAGKTNLAGFALEMGADPNRALESTEEDDGITPLSEAIFHAMEAASDNNVSLADGYVQLVKQLLDEGADPNVLPGGLSEGAGARYAVNAVFDAYLPHNEHCQHTGVQLIKLLTENRADFSKLEKRFKVNYQFLQQKINSSTIVQASAPLRLPGLGGTSVRESDHPLSPPDTSPHLGTP